MKNAITGGWSETTERKLSLDEWDSETVGRLVEFLYTGDYQYPNPVRSSERAENAATSLLSAPRSKWENAGSGPNRPLTPLDRCLDGYLPEDTDHSADWAKLMPFNPQDDYKNAILSNAKVYCLAQYISTSTLRALALKRIFLLLLKIDPLPRQTESDAILNSLDLVNYVYSNTDSLVNSEEPLRKLVSQFTAHNLESLQQREELTHLMSSCSDFLSELIPKICRRLISTPKSPEVVSIPDPVPSPKIGYFTTDEVHHWTDPWRRTSKIIPFRITYPTPPGLPVGINKMNISNSDNIRINAYVDHTGRDRFTINIDSWLNTKLYTAGCAWMEIQSADQNFQFGRYSTTQDHPNHQSRTSRVITFSRAYAAPPTVVVVLTSLDIHLVRGWRVRTYVTDVTAVSFVIHIDSWDTTILYSAAATWIAYPVGMPGVASGRFDTRDVRPLHPPQENTAGHVGFNQGVFGATTPNVFVAFDSLDVDCGENMRVSVGFSNRTAAGMNWSITGRNVYSAGAAYIALA